MLEFGLLFIAVVIIIALSIALALVRLDLRRGKEQWDTDRRSWQEITATRDRWHTDARAKLAQLHEVLSEAGFMVEEVPEPPKIRVVRKKGRPRGQGGRRA